MLIKSNSNSKECSAGWGIYGKADLVHKNFRLKQLFQKDHIHVQILF